MFPDANYKSMYKHQLERPIASTTYELQPGTKPGQLQNDYMLLQSISRLPAICDQRTIENT